MWYLPLNIALNVCLSAHCTDIFLPSPHHHSLKPNISWSTSPMVCYQTPWTYLESFFLFLFPLGPSSVNTEVGHPSPLCHDAQWALSFFFFFLSALIRYTPTYFLAFKELAMRKAANCLAYSIFLSTCTDIAAKANCHRHEMCSNKSTQRGDL